MKVKVNRNETLCVEVYLNEVIPYLKDKNKFKKSDTSKIQLIITNNFISSIDNDEKHVMHSKSDHTEIIIKDGVGEAIKKLFDSLKNRYQNSLESVKASLFLFDYVQVLYHKCH